MVKEIKIGDKIYTFKDDLLGLDFAALLEDKDRDKLSKTVGLIARASQNPKLSPKDIMMLPYGEFIRLIKGFSDIYGIADEFDFLEKK